MILDIGYGYKLKGLVVNALRKRLERFRDIKKGLDNKMRMSLFIYAVFYCFPGRILKMLKIKFPLWIIRGRFKSHNKIFRINESVDYYLCSEKFEELIKEWFDLKGTFLDVGANIGKYSVGLSDKFDRIYSFEPHPVTFRKLLENIRLNGLDNVKPFQLALWDNEGIMKLNINPHHGMNSLVRDDEILGKINVEVTSLDSFFEKYPIDSIELIKIDAEGAEAHILKGARKTLSKFKPRIIVEIWPKYFSDVNKIMSGLGYYLKGKWKENYLYETKR